MTTQHTIHALPSGLFIEKMIWDDDEARYYLVSKGWDDWNRGRRYCITKDEYDALKPFARRVEE